MRLIEREHYLNKLKDVMGTPDIKVITGVRRSGKSKLMESFISHVREDDPDANIIHVNFNMNTAEATLDVLAMVKPEDAAILADVYHTYRGGGSFETYRKFGGNLLPVLHVNDYPGTPPREQLVAADRVWPGAGLAPWRKIFEYLDEAGADPWLSIEVFNPNYWKTTPVQTSKEGYEWLDRTYALRSR